MVGRVNVVAVYRSDLKFDNASLNTKVHSLGNSDVTRPTMKCGLIFAT